MLNGTLRALTRVLLPTPEFDQAAVDRSTEFLQRELSRLPDFLAWPMFVAGLLFSLGSLLFFARPFHALPLEQQIRYTAKWTSAPLAPLRDFVRMVCSLVTLAANETRR